MTSFFLSNPPSIGIEVVGPLLRKAKLCKKRDSWEILSLQEIAIDDFNLPDEKNLEGGPSVSALNTRELLVRPCEIPIKKKKDLMSALEFHIEPLLPYPLDKAIVQTQIDKQTGNSTSLTLFAVRKDHLEHHLSDLTKNQINPEIVTSKAHALAAFSTLFPQTKSPTLWIHDSASEITFVLVESGHLLAVRAVDRNNNLKSELQKTLLHLSTTYKSSPFESIYLLSKDSELKDLLESLCDHSVLIPSSPFLRQSPDELVVFGLAIGCAMSQEGMNFRQKEFVYPNPFKHVKKPLKLFFALILLVVTSIYLFDKAVLAKKKTLLESAYLSLAKSEGETIPPSNFPRSAEDYLIQLKALEKKVRDQPDTHPLLPQVPKAKEVLGWLSSLHESNEVSLETFGYQLIKQPDFSHKKEKYKVRIEIEISAKNPNSAKAFQEALKKPNLFVDLREEIQWAPTKGKYKASFFLKDKTHYI